MSQQIRTFSLQRLRIPLDLPIGDSQVKFAEHWMTLVRLETSSGLTGFGAELQQGIPTAAIAEQEQQFRMKHWEGIENQDPFEAALRIARPRGGNVGAAPMPLAVQTAVWDLAAKSVDLPLFRLLGGTHDRVRAYGSTLDFHLDDATFRDRLGAFFEMGLRAVKIKVGHPDVQWDLHRLSVAKEVFGSDADLMVDANESWSPKEALIRANVYHDAGYNIFWIEDPISREDFSGYQMLCREIGFTRINTGEYLGLTGKRQLLEHHAVDILNLHGHIAVSRLAAGLAGDYGIPVSLGNTIFEIGVHLATSLPECLCLEFSDLAWNRLLKEPVAFRDGYAIAPNRPGHGLELDEGAVEELSEDKTCS